MSMILPGPRVCPLNHCVITSRILYKCTCMYLGTKIYIYSSSPYLVIDHLWSFLASGLNQIGFPVMPRKWAPCQVWTQDQSLVAMAVGAAGSQRVMAHSLASWATVWSGFLTSLHPMVTADLFLHNENTGHFQVSLNGEEVEMKLRGPQARFN